MVVKQRTTGSGSAALQHRILRRLQSRHAPPRQLRRPHVRHSLPACRRRVLGICLPHSPVARRRRHSRKPASSLVQRLPRARALGRWAGGQPLLHGRQQPAVQVLAQELRCLACTALQLRVRVRCCGVGRLLRRSSGGVRCCCARLLLLLLRSRVLLGGPL